MVAFSLGLPVGVAANCRRSRTRRVEVDVLVAEIGALDEVACGRDSVDAAVCTECCGQSADRKSTRLNSSHSDRSRMPSSA